MAQGSARVSTQACPAATPDIEQAAFFGLIGTYVGIIPVLAGLLWLPFIKRLSLQKYRFFLSLTAGLLVFLGIDALVEGSEIAGESVAWGLQRPDLDCPGSNIIISCIDVCFYEDGPTQQRQKNSNSNNSRRRRKSR